MSLRRGMAVPAVLVMGCVLSLIIFGFMKYSGSEMRMVAKFMDTKRAEYLAYAGINWADATLRKGRFYQPPDAAPGKGTSIKTYHMEELKPFGESLGTVKVAFLEGHYKNRNSLKIYGPWEEILVVSNIKVFALGELDGERVLMFGKYVMMPEPIARSQSTDAPGTTGGTPVDPEFSIEEITMSPDVQQEPPDGQQEQLFKLDSVMVTVGQKVLGNQRIMRFLAGSVMTTKRWFPCAQLDGEIAEVCVSPGQVVRVGEVLAKIKVKSGTARPSMTLKRMVQITHVDLRKYVPNVKDFNLPSNGPDGSVSSKKDLDLLVSIANDVSNDYKKAFPKNYSGNYDLSLKIEQAFSSFNASGETQAEVLAKISQADVKPHSDPKIAGNQFIVDMFQKFVPPGRGIEADSKEARDYVKNARFNLGTRPRDPKKETVEILTYSGNSGLLDELKNTTPRNNPEYIDIGSTEKFLDLLRKQGFSENQTTNEMIKSLTFLKRANSQISIDLTKGTPLDYGETIPSGYWDWKGKGWYGPISWKGVDFSSAHYTYENDGTKLRVDNILNYFRKFFEDDVTEPVGSGMRLGNDQEDSPQSPGPPDVTGATQKDGC